MDLDTRKKPSEIIRFIVLIPHRDTGRLLEEYRTRLFSLGFNGAFSFPSAAPLAAVSEPFSVNELKELARNIRNLTKEHNGKILSSGTAASGPAFFTHGSGSLPDTEKSGQISFFGPALNIPVTQELIPPTAKEKILRLFSSPVLCAALTEENLRVSGPGPAGSRPRCTAPEEARTLPEAPALSFRAAALTNLAIRPMSGGEAGYSYEWKMDPPVWLPKNPNGT